MTLVRALLAGLLLCAPWCALHADTKLALKFRPGDVVAQEVLESVQVDVTPPADKRVFTTLIEQRWHLESKTAAREDDGGGEVHQKFTRVAVTLQLPPPVSKRFTVDTSRDEESDEKIENDMRQGISRVVGLEWIFGFKPNGAIRKVELSDELTNTLVENPQVGPLTETFSDAGLRKLSEQTTVTFPEQAVKPGQSWKQVVTRIFPEGKLTTTRTCTYVGPVENGWEKIGVKMQAAYQSNKDAKQPMELTDSSGGGEVFFDPKAGRIVRSKLTQVLELKVGPPEREGTQKITMVNTLLPEADEKKSKDE